jgi:hypothetical protein
VTNEPLWPATLYTSTDPADKNNPCKGKQVPVVTGYSLEYWGLWVYTNNNLNSACAGSDTRYGCTVL